jgi:hypothetical protein
MHFKTGQEVIDAELMMEPTIQQSQPSDSRVLPENVVFDP